MKKDTLTQLQAERLIAIVPADIGDGLVHLARALSRGGISFLEIAMTTPAAVSTLEKAARELPAFRFGLGTVLDVETARLGVLAGASFIVTPSPRPDVITLCRRHHVAVISGTFTWADIATAHAGGADAVKVFPSEEFGPAYIRTLKSAMPEVNLLPIGGVTPETVAEYIRAGAMAMFAGSSLVDIEILERRDWEAVTGRAEMFVRAMALAG